jgi:hypothetical protein
MSFSPKILYRIFPNSFSWSNIGLKKSKPLKHVWYLGFQLGGSSGEWG